jgi:hypothetical protein
MAAIFQLELNFADCFAEDSRLFWTKLVRCCRLNRFWSTLFLLNKLISQKERIILFNFVQ